MTLKQANFIKTVKNKFLTKKTLVVVLTLAAFVGSVLYIGYHGVNYYQARLAEQEAREQAARELLASLGNSSQSTEPEELTLKEIITLYKPRFQALENIALNHLDNLFEEAIEEYKIRRARGTLDRMRFANEYLQKGQRLEKTVDIAFATLLEEMKTELERSSIAPEETRELKAEIKERYQEAKEEKKRELFQQVREKLGS